MSKLNRPRLCDEICKLIHITRKRKGVGHLTKEELLRIYTYLNVVKENLLDKSPRGNSN